MVSCFAGRNLTLRIPRKRGAMGRIVPCGASLASPLVTGSLWRRRLGVAFPFDYGDVMISGRGKAEIMEIGPV